MQDFLSKVFLISVALYQWRRALWATQAGASAPPKNKNHVTPDFGFVAA